MAAFFKVKVGEKVYQLDQLTLGDGVVLKRRFGLTDLENFSSTDAESLLGLMSLAISKTDGIPIAEAQAQAEDIKYNDFAPLPVDEPEEDPTPAAVVGSEETVAPSESGSSVKNRKKPGIQN